MLAPWTLLSVALSALLSGAEASSFVHVEFKPLASTSQASVGLHGLAPVATALPQHECAVYCSYMTPAAFQSGACGGFYATGGVCHLVPVAIAANTQTDANNTYYPKA